MIWGQPHGLLHQSRGRHHRRIQQLGAQRARLRDAPRLQGWARRHGATAKAAQAWVHLEAVVVKRENMKIHDLWTDEKQRWEESEKRREEKRREEKRRRKRKSQKKEDPGARKGRKVAKHCVFPMICGSGGSRSRLAKAAGAEPAGQMRDEKLHAVVARSTFPSQNVQNTPASDHFWKLRCRKSARRCGAKHISK